MTEYVLNKSSLRWIDPRMIVGAAFAAAVIVYVEVDLTFGFGASALFGLFLLLGFVTAFVLVIVGKVRRSRLVLILGTYAFASLSLSVWVFSTIGSSQVRQSFRRGDLIADALDRFRSDTGGYPDSLAVLVPDYVDEVPTTALGYRIHLPFVYSRGDESQTYMLFFSPRELERCLRDFERNLWSCDD